MTVWRAWFLFLGLVLVAFAESCGIAIVPLHEAHMSSEPQGAVETSVQEDASEKNSRPMEEASPLESPGSSVDTERCPTSTTRCAASCVDTQQDPYHCGRCFRLCLPPGQCRSGRCQK
ncbi:MAG: hypothetical protein EP343_08215 [Deltaproteobacteria bacterium]|nr:MAG: hypothetical protein EP343_08215 [Deltaproteobacteria bacterium]